MKTTDDIQVPFVYISQSKLRVRLKVSERMVVLVAGLSLGLAILVGVLGLSFALEVFLV